MKKIPGTMYHFGLTNSIRDTLSINIWYRSMLVFEQTGIFKEEILNIVKNFLESKNLTIPNSYHLQATRIWPIVPNCAHSGCPFLGWLRHISRTVNSVGLLRQYDIL